LEIVVLHAVDAARIVQTLAAEGHRVELAPQIATCRACDLVIVDTAAHDGAAIGELAGRLPASELLLLVDDLDTKLVSGAAMALVKPVDLNKLVRLVRIVDEARRGERDPRDLVDFETLFRGDSPLILELLRRVRLLADSDGPVWLHGELGSGRSVVARAIHDRSRRRDKPFLAVNAAVFPGDLLEEHLFGGVDCPALRLDGGTLFIDAVTELAPGVQAKLLRIVEERRLRLRGIDHWLDVRAMVGDERRTLNVGGRLRRELHVALRVHELDLPPLRERAGDLRGIITHILERLRIGGPATMLTGDAIRALEGYSFPGNMRELVHALAHAAVLARGGPIDVEHLPADIQQASAAAAAHDPGSLESLDAVAKRFERDYLLRVLRAVGGNRTRAAKILELSRKGLWQKLKAHGIAADEGRPDGDEPD
jgi:DNA-binding NtrC family response regulator